MDNKSFAPTFTKWNYAKIISTTIKSTGFNLDKRNESIVFTLFFDLIRTNWHSKSLNSIRNYLGLKRNTKIVTETKPKLNQKWNEHKKRLMYEYL